MTVRSSPPSPSPSPLSSPHAATTRDRTAIIAIPNHFGRTRTVTSSQIRPPYPEGPHRSYMKQTILCRLNRGPFWLASQNGLYACPDPWSFLHIRGVEHTSPCRARSRCCLGKRARRGRSQWMWEEHPPSGHRRSLETHIGSGGLCRGAQSRERHGVGVPGGTAVAVVERGTQR